MTGKTSNKKIIEKFAKTKVRFDTYDEHGLKIYVELKKESPNEYWVDKKGNVVRHDGWNKYILGNVKKFKNETIGVISDVGWMILDYLKKRKTSASTKQIKNRVEMSGSYTLEILHLLEKWKLVKKKKYGRTFKWSITKKGLSPYS